MSNEPKTTDIRISEADVRRILDRAIQLDTVRTNEVTLAELQRVADEVGISTHALTQAVEEYRLGQVPAPLAVTPAAPRDTSWKGRLKRLARPLIIGWVSTIAAFMTAAGGAEEPALFTFILSIAASLVLAILHRMRRSKIALTPNPDPDQLIDWQAPGWKFQLDLLALWFPWTLLNALAEDEIIVVGGLAWAIAAVVGMGIVELFQPKPKLTDRVQQERAAEPQAAL